MLKDYWEETFFDFGVRGYKVESLGKLEHVIKEGTVKQAEHSHLIYLGQRLQSRRRRHIAEVCMHRDTRLCKTFLWVRVALLNG